MEEKIIEYAPILVVLLGFIWQHNLFVKPEQLEKKHREIIDEVDKKINTTETNFREKYVEINAYKEFQNHIYSKLDELTGSIEDLKSLLIKWK